MIATLGDAAAAGTGLAARDAFDAKLAAGLVIPTLRADDTKGQAAMAQCLASGATQAACNAQIGAGIATNGFWCDQDLQITAAGKVCVAPNIASSAKSAAELAEAQKTAAANAAMTTTTKIAIGGGVALVVGLVWFYAR